MKKKVIITMLLTMGVLSLGVMEASAYTVSGPSYTFVRGEGEGERSWDNKENQNYYRQKTKESLAYLEKYGVTYDVKKGAIYYEGKLVNWILDEYCGDEWMTSSDLDGEIGLFVERNDEYEVTGVRVADKEEYEEYSWDYGDIAYRDLQEDVAFSVVEAAAQEVADAIEEDGWDAEEYAISGRRSTAVYEGNYNEETSDKVKEYKKAGITTDKTGSWIWKGQKVRMLIDDDGSFYSNGEAGAKDENIYLMVNRDTYGDISKVEELTSKELLAFLAQRDSKNY